MEEEANPSSDAGELFDGADAESTPTADPEASSHEIEDTPQVQSSSDADNDGEQSVKVENDAEPINTKSTPDTQTNGTHDKKDETKESDREDDEIEIYAILIDDSEISDTKEKIEVQGTVDFFTRRTINKYLKAKGYQDIVLPNIIPKDEIAQMINSNFYKTNAILKKPSYRPESVHEEFERFFTFFQSIKINDFEMSLEIRPMLMPALVVLFRELIANGSIQLANKLVIDFSTKILQEDKRKENPLIVIAMTIMKSMDCLEETFLGKVCKANRKFVLSKKTFDQLVELLYTLKGSALLNLFTNHFQIELKETCDILKTHQTNLHSAKYLNHLKSSRTPKLPDSLLESVIANVPRITAYTMNDRVSCAAISNQASLVAFGMSADTGIRLCHTSCAKGLDDDDTDEDEDEEEEEEEKEEGSVSNMIECRSGHYGCVYGLAFHPKAKLLYSVGEDSRMRCWTNIDTENFGCKVVYKGHYGPIWSVEIAKSGQLIATSGMDSTARIWVPERVSAVRILAGHYLDVDCVKFHPNESYLATGSLDKSARLWSVSNGEIARILTGSEGKVNALAFHYSGNYLLGGGDDDSIKIWDLREGELICELRCTPYCKDLSINGNMLAGCFRNGSVQVWNLRKIIGGDAIPPEDGASYAVAKPFTKQCEASSVVSLYYKDKSQLYCLGSDPIFPSFPDEESITEFSEPEDTISTASWTAPYSTLLDSFSDNNRISDETEMETDINATITSELKSSFPLQDENVEDIIVEDANVEDANVEDANVEDVVVEGIITEDIIAEDAIVEDAIVENVIEDAEAENTSNTITSSDMEYEVDDQILKSFLSSQIKSFEDFLP